MSTIFVEPANLDGSIQHYFHFFFGYLIPFLENVDKHDGNTYLFADCGPVMNKFLIEGVPGYNIKIKDTDKTDRSLCFKGYDRYDFPHMGFCSAKKRVMEAFCVKKQRMSGRVLFIDRGESHPFYDSNAEIPSSGNTRRSVPNMRSVFDEVKKSIPCDLVYLEDMPLREQISLFASRRYFVLQHGAAMCNLIFAESDSCVVEIRSDDEIDYYGHMIFDLGLNRTRILQDHNHAPVSLEDVLHGILKSMKFSQKLI